MVKEVTAFQTAGGRLCSTEEEAEYEELKEIEEGFSGNRRSLKPFWKNITFTIK